MPRLSVVRVLQKTHALVFGLSIRPNHARQTPASVSETVYWGDVTDSGHVARAGFLHRVVYIGELHRVVYIGVGLHHVVYIGVELLSEEEHSPAILAGI
jgi:hypothetical protein